MLKLIYFNVAVLLLLSCNKADKNAYGNWAILEIYHGQVELSYNSSEIYLTPQLFIHNSGSQFNIDFNGKRPNEFGRFMFKNENLIEVTNMPTESLNGDYQISIERTEGNDNSRTSTFELTMESDSVFIRAIKYVTKM